MTKRRKTRAAREKVNFGFTTTFTSWADAARASLDSTTTAPAAAAAATTTDGTEPSTSAFQWSNPWSPARWTVEHLATSARLVVQPASLNDHRIGLPPGDRRILSLACGENFWQQLHRAIPWLQGLKLGQEAGATTFAQKNKTSIVEQYPGGGFVLFLQMFRLSKNKANAQSVSATVAAYARKQRSLVQTVWICLKRNCSEYVLS